MKGREFLMKIQQQTNINAEKEWEEQIKEVTKKEFLEWIKKELKENSQINSNQDDSINYYNKYNNLKALLNIVIDYFNDHDMGLERCHIGNYWPCYLVKYENENYIIGRWNHPTGWTTIAHAPNEISEVFVDLEEIQKYAANKLINTSKNKKRILSKEKNKTKK